MKLNLAFSTCPNDTFIFDAAVHKRIDTEGLEFDYTLADVEELNQTAFKAQTDITKLSFHAFAYISDKYLIADSGSALGHNNGPLLISKRKIYPDEINDLRIAIPGEYTTANLLLGIAYPKANNKKSYLFSEIEEAVLSDEVDAGLIIHENRFTYKAKGLKKLVDLGEFWENKSGKPIPLGAIVIKRSLPDDVILKVNRVIRRSLEFAYKNPEESVVFVKKFAQEMDESVMRKHIDLYVNKYSSDLGVSGREAIEVLFNEAERAGIIPKVERPYFIG